MHIKVTVAAGAKKERVTKEATGRYYIEVREPRERNRANHRVREIISEREGVPLGKVRIVAGHRSPTKVISIG